MNKKKRVISPTVLMFHIMSGTCSEGKPMKVARYHHGSTVLGLKLYVYGGLKIKAESSHIEILALPANNQTQWQQVFIAG